MMGTTRFEEHPSGLLRDEQSSLGYVLEEETSACHGLRYQSLLHGKFLRSVN